jgi:hypothetical protein
MEIKQDLVLNQIGSNFLSKTKFKDLILTSLANLMFIHPSCFQNFNELKTGVAD